MDNTTIGERIKAIRKSRGKTQADVAAALLVKRQTVDQWENDETRDLKTHYTVALADFFGVSCDEILRGVKSENIDTHTKTGLRDAAISNLSESRIGEPDDSLTKRRLLTDLFIGNAEYPLFIFNVDSYFKAIMDADTGAAILSAAISPDRGSVGETLTPSEYAELRESQIKKSLQRILDSMKDDYITWLKDRVAEHGK